MMSSLMKISDFNRLSLGMQAGESSLDKHITLSGRIVFRNRMGNGLFWKILDTSGTALIYARRDILGDERFEAMKAAEIGDKVTLTGFPSYTERKIGFVLHVLSVQP